MNEIPTPRTDAVTLRAYFPAQLVTADFARTLERELVAAQKDLANLFPVGPEGPDGPGPGPKGQPLQFDDLVAARRPLIEALLEAISTTSQCAYHLAELQEPPRRIIQISAASETEDRYQSVFALCNDGTVWRVVNRPSPEDCYWASFPPIPQGKI